MILKKNVAIVGGGASALMLAVELNSEKYSVSIYERNKNLGRKFLVAGDGGLNLTHSEAKIDFSKKYSPSKFMLNAFENFDNKDLINWFKQKGIQTYIGSSNRVFPIKGIKPINVLRVFEDELKRVGCFLFQNYKWIGWNSNNGLVFENNNEIKNIEADIIVFALGGGSWKVTGSDGSWLNLFKDKFIECSPFISSNCAFQVNWQAALGAAEGMALKNCNFFVNGVLIKGEAVLTKYGIEGGAIYALSKEIRENLLAYKMAELIIDFKPTVDEIKIFDFLKSKGNFSTKDILSKKLKLSSVQITLLKMYSTKEEYNNPLFLAKLIKHFTIKLIDFAPIDEAISTVGGVNLHELDKHYGLKKMPKHYCIGEMLDWDAPTGGYLLQACFSMGKYLADYLNLAQDI